MKTSRKELMDAEIVACPDYEMNFEEDYEDELDDEVDDDFYDDYYDDDLLDHDDESFCENCLAVLMLETVFESLDMMIKALKTITDDFEARVN